MSSNSFYGNQMRLKTSSSPIMKDQVESSSRLSRILLKSCLDTTGHGIPNIFRLYTQHIFLLLTTNKLIKIINLNKKDVITYL